MPIANITLGLTTAANGPPPTDQVRWREVFSKNYPEAETYTGKCTHEDVAFLVDPLRLITADWERWAREDLPGELETQYAAKGTTPLKMKIYVGSEPVLFGLLQYPAVRVESWHHGSPGIVLVLALVIGATVVVWAFLQWLFQKAEEVDWLVPAAIGTGVIVILFLLLLLFGARGRGQGGGK